MLKNAGVGTDITRQHTAGSHIGGHVAYKQGCTTSQQHIDTSYARLQKYPRRGRTYDTRYLHPLTSDSSLERKKFGHMEVKKGLLLWDLSSSPNTACSLTPVIFHLSDPFSRLFRSSLRMDFPSPDIEITNQSLSALPNATMHLPSRLREYVADSQSEHRGFSAVDSRTHRQKAFTIAFASVLLYVQHYRRKQQVSEV